MFSRAITQTYEGDTVAFVLIPFRGAPISAGTHRKPFSMTLSAFLTPEAQSAGATAGVDATVYRYPTFGIYLFSMYSLILVFLPVPDGRSAFTACVRGGRPNPDPGCSRSERVRTAGARRATNCRRWKERERRRDSAELEREGELGAVSRRQCWGRRRTVWPRCRGGRRPTRRTRR